MAEAKGSFAVIQSHLSLSDVYQLDIDKVGALVVSDDHSKILGILPSMTLLEGSKNMAARLSTSRYPN